MQRSTVLPNGKPTTDKVHRVTCENGTMVRVSGNNIILSPPLILSDAHVDTVLAVLDAGFACVA